MIRRLVPTLIAAAAMAIALWAQRIPQAAATPVQAVHPRYEVYSVFPQETSPGVFEHVSQSQLQLLADQGWELVSVTPWVIRNEERGPEEPGPRPVVTQSYLAYFFRRERPGSQSQSATPEPAPAAQ